MNTFSPITILVTGFFLALAGAVLPFLMVVQVLESTFFLNFFSFTATMSGLFLGLIGAAYYARLKK
ncbi:MAG: hypothetical protein EHM81_10070 [Chloroflexi bacterium]|jgi:hypothetical protein|nr:MAG: hypothetical protein EHM81_10070 [Chloroflexota bacterium]